MSYRPGKGFRLGKMRERITVQSATVNESTGQPSRTWDQTFVTGEPASYDPAAGGETVSGKQVEANISAVFTVRYRDGYNAEQRLTHNGQIYGIVYVPPVKGGRRYQELHCKSVKNA